MSMNVSSGGSDEPMCDVNTTPLIDVMLVLLVMLIVTLPIQTHGTRLDMPRPPPPGAPPPPPHRVVDIEIDFDGTIVYNGSPVSVAQLDGYFQREAAVGDDPEIHLRPNRRAKYDIVANVMASAQRNHMVRMGFTNVAEFRD